MIEFSNNFSVIINSRTKLLCLKILASPFSLHTLLLKSSELLQERETFVYISHRPGTQLHNSIGGKFHKGIGNKSWSRQVCLIETLS